MPAPDPGITAFADAAAALCAHIDAMRAGKIDQPYTKLMALLTAVLHRGLKLPWTSVELTRQGHLRRGERHAIEMEIASAVSRNGEVGQLHAEHLSFDSEHEALRAFMYDDDLADLYCDLRDGLNHYARGGPADIDEACWHWRWGYEEHWGEHLIRAMLTTHELLYRVRVE
jgi:hypothetical protein